MKIYMDVCCLNRPFDDLTQDRLKLEVNAVVSILSRCDKGEWVLVGSDVIDNELSRIKNTDKLTKVRSLYSIAGEKLKMSESAVKRAVFFGKSPEYFFNDR